MYRPIRHNKTGARAAQTAPITMANWQIGSIRSVVVKSPNSSSGIALAFKRFGSLFLDTCFLNSCF
jgi:hypothetical protein